MSKHTILRPAAPDDPGAPLHVVELRISNFMGIRSACIRPGGVGVVEVAGNNGAGKSTLLRAIEVALGGKKACPSHALRRGEEAGEIILDAGDFLITVKLTEAGERWTVKDGDGNPVASPIEALQRIYNRFCVDPFAFRTAKPAERRETLMQVAGLDFAEVDQLKATAFEERTNVNRTIKRIEAIERDRRQEWPADLPDEEIDAGESLDRWKAGTEARAAAEETRRRCEALRADITRLEADLANKRATLKAAMFALEEPVPTAEALATIRGRIDKLAELNAKVRARKAWQVLVAELDAAREEAAELTRTIEDADKGKAELLAAAEMPVPGLGVTDDDVTFNGLPFDQASESEQMRVSVAIALALNPRFRTVLVRAGYAMDARTRALFEKTIIEANAQAFIEVLEATGPGGVIMVDGVARPALLDAR